MQGRPRCGNQKGFTLIELLVVIAIIGILSIVAMVSFNSARAKARDARRVAEIREIQKALELYYADHGQYPLSGGSSMPNNGWSNSIDASWNSLQAELAPYLSTFPRDPINSTDGWSGYCDGYNYSYFSRGYGCPQQWYMLVYRPEVSGIESPGVIACDGSDFQYTHEGYNVTVGECKGC